MTITSCRQIIYGFIAVLGSAAFAPQVAAQAPPRPTVDIRQMPTLRDSVIPADFNGDGRIDLIAGERDLARLNSLGPVWVRLGNGNGSFGAPLSSGVIGIPVAVGDFNGDNRLDAVVLASGGGMSILPGRGNGKFDPPRAIDDVEDFRFALSADMNGDGDLDLVLGDTNTVYLRTGNGDFTFVQHPLPPGGSDLPSIAVATDLNGDHRLDLAVGQQTHSIFIYLNQGGTLFSATEIVVAGDDPTGLPEEIRGIAAADLDGDGDQDLVVPHSAEEVLAWSEGGVEVLLGRGNGTFAAPVRYSTGLRGPRTAALGDFNGDGFVDAAIGGRSHGWDDLQDFLIGWDTVTIFPGRGNGTLAPPARFRLDTTAPGAQPRSTYVDTHTALRAANFNGDARMDLVASPGAVILLRPPAANRPPVVNAGPDRVAFPNTFVLINGTITEPDWDWVMARWSDHNGALAGFGPSITSWAEETQTLTLTVTDDRGGSATDSVTITRIQPENGELARIISPTAGQRFPSGSAVPIRWIEVSELTQAHGTRVLVSSDNFQSWRVLAETFGAQPAVTWTNAGPPGTNWRVRIEIFADDGGIRTTLTSDRFTIDPPAGTALPWPWEHADVGFVGVPGSATQSSGVFTVRGAGEDVWGTADAFHFAYQQLTADGTITARVTNVAGSQAWTKVGIMIRESLAESAAHHFLLVSEGRGLAYQRRPTTGGSSLNTTLPSAAQPVFRIRRRGGTLQIQMASGVGATFQTIANASFPRGIAYVGLVTSSHDTARLATGTFDRVVVQGGGDLPPRVSITAPRDVTLQSGQTARVDWTASDDIGIERFDVFLGDSSSRELVTLCFELPANTRSCSFTVPNIVDRSATLLVRAIDVAGHVAEATSTIAINDAAPGSMPVNWSSSDIGDVGAPGSAVEANGQFTVRGSGAQVWGTTDELHFAGRPIQGDFEFVARVVSVENVNEWTKAGLMARNSNISDWPHAFVLATPTTRRGVVFHRRTTIGGTTTHTQGPRVAPPVWLRLVREGAVISAYSRLSATAAWTLIGAETFGPPIGDAMTLGFAVASYRDGTLATAVFDNVTIVQR
jgi:hypothetical protein